MYNRENCIDSMWFYANAVSMNCSRLVDNNIGIRPGLIAPQRFHFFMLTNDTGVSRRVSIFYLDRNGSEIAGQVRTIPPMQSISRPRTQQIPEGTEQLRFEVERDEYSKCYITTRIGATIYITEIIRNGTCN